MAGRRIDPNAENCTLVELETAIAAAVSKRSHQRLLAMRALLMGISREQVAGLFCVTVRTLIDWIRRFNAQGIDGLIERPHPGRTPHISPEQTPQYRQLIENPSEVGQTHWTARKFHGHLREQLGVEVGYRTVVRWLHEQGFRLKVPQPWPDRQDEKSREAFVQLLSEHLADAGIELWFSDEMGVEGDPRPRRRWAQKGEKTRVTHNGDHVRMNVCGMVCPRTGQFYALEFSHSDRETFQCFLDHANADIQLERPRNLLICDNASWHKSKSLNWGKFEVLFLPPYSPDLNPIERLWLLIKAEWFCDFVAKDRDALISRLDSALNWAMGRAPANQQTCTIKKEI
jgi:transposase